MALTALGPNERVSLQLVQVKMVAWTVAEVVSVSDAGMGPMGPTGAMVAVAMLNQPTLLNEGHLTALAMLVGAVGLLPMTGLMTIGVMVDGMLTAVGAHQHQLGKGHTLGLALKGNMQDLQLGHQALMTDP